jgi:hypothetical protein
MRRALMNMPAVRCAPLGPRKNPARLLSLDP